MSNGFGNIRGEDEDVELEGAARDIAQSRWEKRMMLNSR
jgi:hypothetical protein